jgi:two-component system, OmpR family, sensor kinase
MAMLDPSASTPAWSLEKRLRVRLMFWFSLLWLVGVGVAVVALREEVGEVLDSALIETAQSLLALPDTAGVTEVMPPPSASIGATDGLVVWQIFDDTGHMQMRSHKAPAQALAGTSDLAGADEPQDLGDWRVVRQASANGRRVVYAAESRSHRKEVIWESSMWLLYPLLAVLPLSAFALRRVLRTAFKTLEPAQASLAGSTAELRPLPVDGMALEFQPLMHAMNSLMERMRNVYEAERRVSAQAAHELRTPLAAARAQAQRMEQLSNDPDQAERARAMVRSLDHVTTVASRTLQLARIESGIAQRHEPVDLRLLATVMLQEFADAGASGRLRLGLVDGAATVLGDIDALGIALRNLIDNALKHAGSQARVTVRADDRSLEVVDDGPGVAPADLARLVRPFQRGTQAIEGSGLGLAMVDIIARQSGAVLELRSPVNAGHGFAATLRFAA